MELLYWQQRGWSGCAVAAFVFVLFLATCFALAAVGAYAKDGWLRALVPGFAAAFLLFLCFCCVYSFVQNEVWSLRIEDEAISWSSPRWPRSSGRIDIDTITKLVIFEGCGRIEVTTRDGKSTSIPCNCARGVYRVCVEHPTHFEHISVEFIEDP